MSFSSSQAKKATYFNIVNCRTLLINRYSLRLRFLFLSRFSDKNGKKAILSEIIQIKKYLYRKNATFYFLQVIPDTYIIETNQGSWKDYVAFSQLPHVYTYNRIESNATNIMFLI